jgi:4-amino-4-deoxy-L-arabinose transferase-like glycosyltransferase
VSRWGWLGLILGVTALGRVVFLLLLGHTLSFQASGYDAYATSLLAGAGFAAVPGSSPDSALPPLYPFWLAGLYGVVGRSMLVVALAQLGLDLVATLLLYSIGRRVAGPGTGLVAALLYGLYPYLLFQNLTVNDTGVFIAILVASIRLVYAIADRPSAGLAAALGLLLGAGTLTKSFTWLLLPPVAIWWVHREVRRPLLLSLVALAALVATVAPWVVRNTLLHGTPVFVSTNLGSNLHQGNNRCVVAYLARGWDAQWVDCLGARPAGLSEPEADHWHRREALRYLGHHLHEWPRLFATKLGVLWSPRVTPTSLPPGVTTEGDPARVYHTRIFEAARVVHVAYFGPLLGLGVLGLAWAWRARLPVGPLLIVPALLTVVYVVFHPSTRYRAPADPFLFVFAGYALVRAWSVLSSTAVTILARKREPARPGTSP